MTPRFWLVSRVFIAAALDEGNPAIVALMKNNRVAYPMGGESSGTAKSSQNSLARSPMEPAFAPFMPGHCSITSDGRRVIPSAKA
jgi:hypothetical protein